MEAVLSKVAGAPTVPICNLSVIFSFRLAGMTPPEYPGCRLLELGGHTYCSVGCLQLEGLLEGLTECILASQE
jgi:hypothetical protein